MRIRVSDSGSSSDSEIDELSFTTTGIVPVTTADFKTFEGVQSQPPPPSKPMQEEFAQSSFAIQLPGDITDGLSKRKRPTMSTISGESEKRAKIVAPGSFFKTTAEMDLTEGTDSTSANVDKEADIKIGRIGLPFLWSVDRALLPSPSNGNPAPERSDTWKEIFAKYEVNNSPADMNNLSSAPPQEVVPIVGEATPREIPYEEQSEYFRRGPSTIQSTPRRRMGSSRWVRPLRQAGQLTGPIASDDYDYTRTPIFGFGQTTPTQFAQVGFNSNAVTAVSQQDDTDNESDSSGDYEDSSSCETNSLNRTTNDVEPAFDNSAENSIVRGTTGYSTQALRLSTVLLPSAAWISPNSRGSYGSNRIIDRRLPTTRAYLQRDINNNSLRAPVMSLWQELEEEEIRLDELNAGFEAAPIESSIVPEATGYYHPQFLAATNRRRGRQGPGYH